MVHASSNATAAAVQELLQPERVEVIPLGAVAAPAPPAVGRPAGGPDPIDGLDGRPFVVAIGTVEVRKNLPRLVAAFAAIAGDHPDLALVIAGSPGNDSDAVDAAVETLPADAARQGAAARAGRPSRHAPGCCTTRACSPTPRSTKGSASRCSRR